MVSVSFLVEIPEPVRQIFDNLVGQPTGSGYLPYRPRRRRGVEVDHGSQGTGVRRPKASLAPTRPVPGWVPITRSSTKKVRNESERREWRQKAQLPCFYLYPYFGDSRNPRIFGGLTVFCQRVPKIQVMLGISPCYGLAKKTGNIVQF